MIRQLTGQLTMACPPVFIVDVGGVGYEVLSSTLQSSLHEQVTISVYTVVREDALTLYGFRDEAERGLFALLLSVSGVGPKSALQIIGQLGVDQITAALAASDPRPFRAVKGVGQKVAERLVLDLSGSLQKTAAVAAGSLEIASALENLGYGRREYGAVLKELPPGALDEQLAWALARLARR